MFKPGAVVKLIEDVGDVPAGTIGIVVGRYTNDDTLLLEVYLGAKIRAAETAVESIDVDSSPIAA